MQDWWCCRASFGNFWFLHVALLRVCVHGKGCHWRSGIQTAFIFANGAATTDDWSAGMCPNYAWTAALCDLGDPGWGDPWFPHWALLLLSPSCLAPLCCSVFSLFCFFFGGHTHNDTQDVIVHVILIAGSDPSSLCFLFVLVWLWFCVFCLLGCFCFWFVVFSWWDRSLDCVQVHYQCFCGYRQVDSLAW